MSASTDTSPLLQQRPHLPDLPNRPEVALWVRLVGGAATQNPIEEMPASAAHMPQGVNVWQPVAVHRMRFRGNACVSALQEGRSEAHGATRDREFVPGREVTMNTRTQREFMAVNSAVLPLWLAMILFPRSPLTRRMMSRLPALLTVMGVGYAGLLGRAALQQGLPRNLFDGDGWRQVLASPQGFVTGWAHFAAFDLFVGRWIWETALAEGRGCRVALTFTCLAGPIGLMIFSLQRRLAPRP